MNQSQVVTDLRCRAAAPATDAAAEGDDAAAEDDGAAAEDDGAAAEGDGAAAEGDGAAAEGDGAAAEDTGAAAETRRLKMITTPIASPTVWFLYHALTCFLVPVCHVVGSLFTCVRFLGITSPWYLIRWFWLIGVAHCLVLDLSTA